MGNETLRQWYTAMFRNFKGHLLTGSCGLGLDPCCNNLPSGHPLAHQFSQASTLQNGNRMDNPLPSYVVGKLAEFLAITAGKVNGTPVALLTFRPHVTSPQPVNLMISRAHLMRLREDIDALLAHWVSVVLTLWFTLAGWVGVTVGSQVLLKDDPAFQKWKDNGGRPYWDGGLSPTGWGHEVRVLRLRNSSFSFDV